MAVVQTLRHEQGNDGPRQVPHTVQTVITTPFMLLLGELIRFHRAERKESVPLRPKSRKYSWILVIFTQRLAFAFRDIRVLLRAEGMYRAHYNRKPQGTKEKQQKTKKLFLWCSNDILMAISLKRRISRHRRRRGKETQFEWLGAVKPATMKMKGECGGT